MIYKILQQEYYGNTVLDYAIAISIFVISVLLIKIIKYFINRHYAKSKVDEEIKSKFKCENINKYVIPLLYIGVFYGAFESLVIPKAFEKSVQTLFIIISTWYIVKFAGRFLNFVLSGYINNMEGESGKKKVKALTSLLNVLLYVLGFLFLLDNLGVNITGIVAGLGIGGIAVALAAQAILGDLFSYFVIFFDRPFEIGDVVNLGLTTGTIEQIGIKSTKIRSLSGELIIISNSNLTNSQIHNFKALKKRRVIFSLGVTYQTKAEKLKIIPEIVESIIKKYEKAEFDRCTFASFGDFSLNYETVMFFDSPDYKEYMQTLHKINLDIYEEFEKHKIDFAYPTQSIYLEKN